VRAEDFAMGHPTVYPTGVTLYDPSKAFGGYTVFQAAELGALLIDMNGREVRLWRGLQGFPNKLLPGGHVLGSTGQRDPRYGMQDQLDLVEVDWDGRIVWRFSELEQIADPGSPVRFAARQHHDYQREGSPVGYFAPGQAPRAGGGRTLVLVHEDVKNQAISPHPLLDDRIIELDEQGKIVWSWHPHEHVDELGFDTTQREVLARSPNLRPLATGAVGDWLHINSVSYLGPNRHWESGDARFHPSNVIWGSREANIIAIVDKQTGKVVWRLGPHYAGTPALDALGWIIGQHHPHLIPAGLPGAGNLLVFDNGGWAGYGPSHPAAKDGTKSVLRDYSRVLEIDPITLRVVWQYTPAEAGFVLPLDASRFYSPFISSAQRLPNGSTLITEGSNGRILEVTREHELVWEYVSPYWGKGALRLNLLYRAYRAPYAWVPQLPTPEERAIPRLDPATFRVPGAAGPGVEGEVTVAGVAPEASDASFCVATR
jgi:Arylsulfotransferase (ASST)